MLKKRIIPCLDIKNGRTVKGTNFINLKDAGDPVELARAYSEQQADELVFLDITATNEHRKTSVDLAKRVAHSINIPFTIGGGISSLEGAYDVLEAGADKVALNSAAVRTPGLISDLAVALGSQCVVVAIDYRQHDGVNCVYTSGGSERQKLELTEWACEAVERGAGELLLTGMGNDGTQKGFDVDTLGKLSERLDVPIIASGGAGSAKDFEVLFSNTRVTGALAASVFHFGQIELPELKKYLNQGNIAVRL